jgi:hypothetical protein
MNLEDEFITCSELAVDWLDREVGVAKVFLAEAGKAAICLSVCKEEVWYGQYQDCD